MLIATLTAFYLLIFFGTQEGLVEQINRLSSAVTNEVTAEEQAREVQAALEEMRKAANAFEQEILGLRHEFFEVDANYDSKPEDYEQVFSELDAAWLRMQRRIIQLRYRMLGSMTREEWRAVFGAPDGE